jgi:hypothetical protein
MIRDVNTTGGGPFLEEVEDDNEDEEVLRQWVSQHLLF